MIDGSSPAREIAHFIAKILAARPTTSEEVPDLVISIRDTLAALSSGEIPSAPTNDVMASRPTGPAPSVPRRKRRNIAAVKAMPEVSEVAEPVIPAVPQLMRRADVAPAPQPLPFDMSPPQNGTLRGVVRWFDLTTRQGTLRLPGFGDEVTIDAATLERAGISRLYKGQEIEATVVGSNGSVQLVSLALPGRVAPEHGLFKTGAARRNAKPVVVEMKRDSMRRTAARIEAEQILGNGRGRPG
jgi:hypothetical protein